MVTRRVSEGLEGSLISLAHASGYLAYFPSLTRRVTSLISLAHASGYLAYFPSLTRRVTSLISPRSRVGLLRMAEPNGYSPAERVVYENKIDRNRRTMWHKNAWLSSLTCWMIVATSLPTAGQELSDGPPRASQRNVDAQGIHWNQWRGPEATGISRTANPPIEWSENENVRWKVAIDGQGNASPIVWGGKVFLLTAINTQRVDPSLPKPEDQPKRVFGIKHPNTFFAFHVVCLDMSTGNELWRQTATEVVPHEGTHHDADFASASPTTDGERLYCWFGSAGFYCYDLDGKKLWQRDLGKAHVGASLGEGCSPVVHKGKVVIVRDHARQSSIEVFDARTGNTLWKKDRDEPNAWATPRIVEHGGQTQVITAASNLIRSYDLDTGQIIWQCSGLTGNVTPCPVVDGDVVLCMSGYEGHALLALPLSARGDVSNSDEIVWSRDIGTPYVPSPLLFDGMLYFTQSNRAILTVVKSQTGDILMSRTRIPGLANIYSSPVGANGRVYFTGRNGTTVVLQRSNQLKVLATNRLEDEFNTSPALVGPQLLLRGRKSLYCLENQNSLENQNNGNDVSPETQASANR